MEQRVINPWTWQDEFSFSQAIEVRGAQRTLFCSGQASQSPDGAPAHAGDMRAQAARAIDNLETVLDQAGFALGDVVRMTIYTTDMDLFFAEGIGVLLERFSAAGCKPASTLLGVSRLAYPELLIEFEAVAMA